jgi:hypothetical protein
MIRYPSALESLLSDLYSVIIVFIFGRMIFYPSERIKLHMENTVMKQSYPPIKNKKIRPGSVAREKDPNDCFSVGNASS